MAAKLAALAILGTSLILFGLIMCTQRVENYWSNRTPRPTRKPMPPPFRTTATQCVDCGLDGDLLDLDGRCIYCFELR